MLLYERAFAGTRFQLIPARSVTAAAAALAATPPSAIILDIRVHGEDIWDFLAKLKREERTRRIPLIVVSTTDDRQKGFALGADAYGLKPVDRAWLLNVLDGLVPSAGTVRVLAVDDEEAARYIIREMLHGTAFELVEAASGVEALRKLDEQRPDVVLLDLQLGDMTGLDVYQRLRDSASGVKLPVVMVTSHRLTKTDRRRLGETVVLSKETLTRERLVSAIQAVLPAAQLQ
jgi:CheY-like chemotaxis protein